MAQAADAVDAGVTAVENSVSQAVSSMIPSFQMVQNVRGIKIVGSIGILYGSVTLSRFFPIKKLLPNTLQVLPASLPAVTVDLTLPTRAKKA